MYSYRSFKNEFTFQQRCEESRRVLLKYPDKVPIICEPSLTSSHACPLIDKRKYLVSKDLTIGQFLFVIKNRLRLNPEKALFIFVNNTIPSTTSLIEQIYYSNRDSDCFLYLTYAEENVFG